MNNTDFISKIHLVISVLVVVPTAIIYGFYPDLFLEISPSTMDESSFLKAVMGIYVGFSILWLLGIRKRKYLGIALVSNIVFMLGLGLGRVLSLLIDGSPTNFYLFGAFAELFLGCYGIWVLITQYIKKL